ncbi:MAG TPA: AMP-binding protein [Acidimicrobiia bacterium]|nr:AMP-binding protein [Acidimicrobiia bacterium]
MGVYDDSDAACTADQIRSAWEAGRPVFVPTSGTMGDPRLIEHAPASVEASCRAVSAALAVDPDRDRWLACLPLRHVAGRAILLRGAISETPVVVHERFDVAAVAAAAGTCTLVSLVATQLGRLLDAHAPLERFRAVLLGGGPVPPDLLVRARNAGVVVHTTYGLTETFGGCVHDGVGLPGVEIRLDDVSHEILVRGPVLMRRYVDDAPATRAAFTDDGWLRTGDVGSLDNAGRVRVVDRIKDLVITGGVNVSPVAVERVLAEHPGVADVCVVGASDPEWGERVVAWVVPAPPKAAPTLAELRAFGRDRLAAAELPREVRLVGAVPRTPGGKPLRRLLRDARAR